MAVLGGKQSNEPRFVLERTVGEHIEFYREHPVTSPRRFPTYDAADNFAKQLNPSQKYPWMVAQRTPLEVACYEGNPEALDEAASRLLHL